MLKSMENEVEIFRAWLLKYVKIDRKVKAKELADKIGIPSPRISQYHSGRIDNNVRTFPNIPFGIREKILEATNTSYEEMLETGRKELTPKIQHDTYAELEKKMDEKVDAKFREFTETISTTYKPDTDSIQNLILTKHQKIVSKFQRPEKALDINSDLLKLEKLNPKSLDKIHEYIKDQLLVNGCREELKKKSTG